MNRYTQLIIVDPGVEDWRTLARDLPADAKLVVLHPAQDGVHAIARAAAGLGDLDAIHIVAHGSAAELRLGNARLSAATLDEYAESLERIGAALNDGGDILLYGCEVARGIAGRRFIDDIARITGANVAAASHPVGAAARGGNWELDVSIGAVASRAPFVPQAMAAFTGLLQQFFDNNSTVANNAIDGGSGAWDSATTNWTNASGAANAAYDNTAGTVTVFGASGVLIPATAGTVTVQGGGIQLTSTVQFRAVGDFSTYTIAGGNLTTAVGGTTFDLIDVSSSTASDATISAVIGGTGAVNKAGVGTLTLSGANNYSGETVITAGTLALSGAGKLGSASGFTTVNGATAVLDLGSTSQAEGLRLQGGGTVQNGTLTAGGYDLQSGTVSAVLAGGSSSSAVTKTTAGTVTLTGANTYAGRLIITGGTLALSGAGTLGGNQILSSLFPNIVDGAATILDLGGTSQTLSDIRLQGGGTIKNGILSFGFLEVREGTVSAVLAGSGGVNKGTANEIVTFSGANTYSGGTVLDVGTLVLAGAGTLGSTEGRTILRGQGLSPTQTILDLGGTSQTQNDFVSLQANGIIKNGTLTSAGANAFDMESGTVSAVLAGSDAALTKRAGHLPGTVTLSGANTYGGATAVAGGTLIVNGSIANSTTMVSGGTFGGNGTAGAVQMNGGNLSPGDGGAGNLTTGNLSFSSFFTGFVTEIGGTGAGTTYDQVDVNGAVSLGSATLYLSLINGFTPSLGQTFVIINNDGSDAVTGTFLALAEGTDIAAGGYLFTISYVGGTGNDVVLTLATNDAPVNTVPGAQSIAANAKVWLSGLSVSDPDSAGATITTTLSVTHGTLEVNSAGFIGVAGSGTADVTLTGTAKDIAMTLSGGNRIIYTPAHDFFGTDTLTITTNDGGNAGIGGVKSDTDQVTINIGTIASGTSGDDNVHALPGSLQIDGGNGIDTITFNFRLVDATVTYADNRIIVTGPSSYTVLNGFERFVFSDGTIDNNDGNPLVDDLFYYASHHDVWNAKVDADAHYNTFGWKEGRNPNAFFDTKGYLATYTDVANAGVNPLGHYAAFGWKEGRDPSTAFDVGDYLSHYIDVALAGVDPLAHFLLFGAQEHRTPFNDGAWG